jgi:hypothetical protein
MSVFDKIHFVVTGQVDGDCNSREKDIVEAKLKLICAEHELELEEVSE